MRGLLCKSFRPPDARAAASLLSRATKVSVRYDVATILPGPVPNDRKSSVLATTACARLDRVRVRKFLACGTLRLLRSLWFSPCSLCFPLLACAHCRRACVAWAMSPTMPTPLAEKILDLPGSFLRWRRYTQQSTGPSFAEPAITVVSRYEPDVDRWVLPDTSAWPAS